MASTSLTWVTPRGGKGKFPCMVSGLSFVMARIVALAMAGKIVQSAGEVSI